MFEIWQDFLLWASSTQEAGSLSSPHQLLASISDQLSLSPSCATALASTSTPVRVTVLLVANKVTRWEITRSPVPEVEIELPDMTSLEILFSRRRRMLLWLPSRRKDICYLVL